LSRADRGVETAYFFSKRLADENQGFRIYMRVGLHGVDDKLI